MIIFLEDVPFVSCATLSPWNFFDSIHSHYNHYSFFVTLATALLPVYHDCIYHYAIAAIFCFNFFFLWSDIIKWFAVFERRINHVNAKKKRYWLLMSDCVFVYTRRHSDDVFLWKRRNSNYLLVFYNFSFLIEFSVLHCLNLSCILYLRC